MISVRVMFKEVNDIISDIGIGSCIFLNLKLLSDKASTLPLFKRALVLLSGSKNTVILMNGTTYGCCSECDHCDGDRRHPFIIRFDVEYKGPLPLLFLVETLAKCLEDGVRKELTLSNSQGIITNNQLVLTVVVGGSFRYAGCARRPVTEARTWLGSGWTSLLNWNDLQQSV